MSFWTKIALALSLLSLVVSLIAYVKQARLMKHLEDLE
jgi:hypothetical protein